LAKEDGEGWQKVKKGNATKTKEKKSQYPEKKNLSRPEVNEGPAKSTEVTEPQLHDPSTSEIPEPTPEPTISKNLDKSQDEHISLRMESGGQSDGGTSESSSSHGTPERPSRGRKPKKKKREEQSYWNIAQGAQHTIPEMMSTRSTRKQGKAPKGATTLQIVK
jgi:hypothetical protein